MDKGKKQDEGKKRVEGKEHLARPQDLLSTTQLEKLELEIKSLKQKSRMEPFLQFVPMVTMLLGITGFLFGFYQFQAGQEKERDAKVVEQRLRLQTQMRADIDELLRFHQDQNIAMARPSFLLADLNTIFASPIDEKKTMADFLPDYRQSITENLVNEIINGSDFEKRPRDVVYATSALEHWADYSEYLKKHSESLDWILSKYRKALLNLMDTNDSYFSRLRYYNGKYYLLPQQTPEKDKDAPSQHAQQEDEERLYLNFTEIRKGFVEHLKLIGEDSAQELKEIRKKNLQQVQASKLCATSLPQLRDELCAQK